MCSKEKLRKKAPSTSPTKHRGVPMERIAMNILGPLPKTLRGNRYVLVISDYFTKWTESYLLPDQIATSIAEGCIGIGESFWRTTINPQRPRNKF